MHLRSLHTLLVPQNELDDATSLPARLTLLDVSDNRLCKLREVLEVLRGAAGTCRLRALWLRGNPFDDIELGHGVHASTVVTWGFDDVEPAVSKAYRASVAEALPKVTLDGIEERPDPTTVDP